MFSYLKRKHINTGLHFWAAVRDYQANIAYPGPTLSQTRTLIKKSLDNASQNGFHYVNIHSGNQALVKLSFEKETTTAVEESKINLKDAVKIQNESLELLNEYAKKKNVLLLAETVPAKETKGSWYDRKARNREWVPTIQFSRPTFCKLPKNTTSALPTTSAIPSPKNSINRLENSGSRCGTKQNCSRPTPNYCMLTR